MLLEKNLKFEDEPAVSCCVQTNPSQSEKPGTQLYFVWREVTRAAQASPTAFKQVSTKSYINFKEQLNMGHFFIQSQIFHIIW